MKIRFLYSCALLFNFYDVGAGFCSLSLKNDFDSKSPLLITDDKFVYPDATGKFQYAINEVQEAHCPERMVMVAGMCTTANSIRLICSACRKFYAPGFDSEEHMFNTILCNKKPVSSVRVNRNCPKGQLIEIGFQIKCDQFVRIIDLCHDSDAGRTYWAHSVIVNAIENKQKPPPSAPTFKTDGFSEEICAAEAYTRKSQRRRLLNIFDNNQDLVNKYLPETGDFYFAKGHLVAKVDMFYNAQQDGTFYYVNAQPMYQSVNNGNWKVVENIVRSLATNYGDLDVWTGNLYNLVLENKEIYLALNARSTSKALVAPKLFFKLVYSQRTREAAVFVTANNPFLPSTLPNDYKVCSEPIKCPLEDTEKFRKVDKGYTYCCPYQEFMNNKEVQSIGLPRLSISIDTF